MERNVNFTYIGGLFVLLVIAMVGFVIWMGGGSLDQSKFRPYVLYSHEGLSGVGVGTSVRYKGIVVGKVQALGFKKGDTNLIQLDVLIDSQIPIYQNACLSIETQGLAGGSFLNLIQGSGERLNSGSELCYQKGFMGKLLDNIDKSGGDTREIIAQVKEMFNEQNGQNIQEIIVALKVILQNLEETRQNIDKLSIAANKTIDHINVSLERGDYNIRSIVAPAMLGIENSLGEMNRFFSKANLLLNRLEKSPYEAIFGEREKGKKE
ncbi:MlaD family protein [Helicobacter pametensis]|uniref:MlaD family protein n=1 Tax=Helicobacter pametensis TaxID=95149 RepID=UPI000488DAC6|nr:MlaD family protein [Helicobacter pametensis]